MVPPKGNLHQVVQAQLDRASRYFPLVGVIVGAIGAGVTEAAALVLPVSLAILLGMVATVLATGAFHEDGLADTCDGMGGGWDTLQVLSIMKDSRIGSYGAVGVVLVLLFKFTALVEIDHEFGPCRSSGWSCCCSSSRRC